ncbi:MAG: 50S ribosomal protein L21 [Rhodospirillales bacterium]
MFAVIRTGGKQYRVAENDRITVEKLPGEPGSRITLSDVLMIGGDGSPPTVGTGLGSAAVFAEVVSQGLGDKVLVFKKKRRKNHRRLKGHRQQLTVLRIEGISPTGEPPAADVVAAAEVPAATAGEAAAAESETEE